MKRLRLKISQVVLALLFCVSSTLNGQEMLGLVFSDYSGISSAAINPARLTGTKVYLDIDIISGNVSLANNMFYFGRENKTIQKTLRVDDSIFYNGNYRWGRTFNYYDNTRDKYFSSGLRLTGPSIMLQNGRHAFGISTAFNSFHAGNNIPYTVPITFYEGLSVPEYYDVEFNNGDYSIVSMSWSEIGLNYAYDFYNYFGNRITFGLSVQALFGYEGGYANIRNSNYVIHDASTVDFKNFDAELAYALPVSYGNELATDFRPVVKGYGVGFDLGMVFTKLKSTYTYEGGHKLCEKPYDDYLYKIGISVLDIGGITFTKDAELHQFNNVSKYWEEFDTINFRGIKDAVQIYSRGFYGDSDASYSGDRIRVNLPATISLQFDYHLREKLYLSALWMHPLRFNPRTLWRPAQLAFVPRYETRYFSVSLPLSIYNYAEPRLGLAVRIYSLTVGTERLGSLMGISDFNGMDFYFSIRFNITKGACLSYNRGACSNSRFGSDW
ncbi:MAG: DUF5723 family protein [Bacteroidales bacterium]|nr:DUF5723 family protein [Bacteroidales bacterium]